jgi:hypothetical protein
MQAFSTNRHTITWLGLPFDRKASEVAMAAQRIRPDEIKQAYQGAMLKGDQTLAASLLEQKMLQAAVAESMAETARFARSRLPEGEKLAAGLEQVLPAVQHGNWVGQSLEAAKAGLLREARSSVISTFTTAVLPVWVTSAVAFLIGIFGMAQDAGAATGAQFIAILAGGGSITYALFRSAQAAPAVAHAIGGAAKSLLARAGTVGAEAEAVFAATVGPQLAALYGSMGLPPPKMPVIGEIRSAAKSIVLLTYAVVAICALFFIIGFWNVVDAWATQHTCVRLPDGTCA